MIKRCYPDFRRFFIFQIWICILVAFSSGYLLSLAQASENSLPPDTLILENGDQLTGQLDRTDGSTVFFKTDTVGEVKAPWSKIKELHSKRIFAVITVPEKGTKDLSKGQVSSGPIDVANRMLVIHTRTGKNIIPVKKIGFIVDRPTYDANISKWGFFNGWSGSITAGASIVSATQTVNTYNTGISLVRSVPKAPWLNTSYRTSLNFSSTYGSISQPNTPSIETNIYHGDAEQDKYLSQDLYVLAHAIIDHNSTQGLNLQQTYGGGLGYTFLKTPKHQFNLTITLDYTNQQFQLESSNKNLVGNNFGENYFYKFTPTFVWSENFYIQPEWNNMNAYSANFTTGIVIPLFNKLAFSIQVIDSYLNDPMPGFDKNSLQINSGITYTLG